jgi:hypothetical protein
MVTTVLPGARIGEEIGRHAGEAEAIIEFAVKQQTTVRTDGRAFEGELDRAVKLKPQGAELSFTRRVRRQLLPPSCLTHCHYKDITDRASSETQFIWDMRGKS